MSRARFVCTVFLDFEMKQVGVFKGSYIADVLLISHVYLETRLFCLKSFWQTKASKLSCLPRQDVYYLMHAWFGDKNCSLSGAATRNKLQLLVTLRSV